MIRASGNSSANRDVVPNMAPMRSVYFAAYSGTWSADGNPARGPAREDRRVLGQVADVPISVIDPADIAAVAALALTTDAHESRSYRLTGPAALLPADRARVLGELLGRLIELTRESDGTARQRMATAMPEPMVDAFFQFFRRGGYDDSHDSDVAPRLLGRALHTFRDWAVANADAFR